MTNYLIRGALPSLVPIIAKTQGWSENQVALLLSAFYPGYLLTQIPSGLAVKTLHLPCVSAVISVPFLVGTLPGRCLCAQARHCLCLVRSTAFREL